MTEPTRKSFWIGQIDRKYGLQNAVRVGIVLVVPSIVVCVFVLSNRESASRSECENQLKMIGLALHQYVDSHDSFPAGTVFNPGLITSRRLSWLVSAWSEGIGDGQLHLEGDRSKARDQWPNRAMKVSSIEDREGNRWNASPVYRQCPAHPLPELLHQPKLLAYVGVGELGLDAPTLPANHEQAGMFAYDRVTRVRDVTDGLSNTMMVIETSVDNGPWTAGGWATVRPLDSARQPYIGAGRQFGGYHRDGVNVLFADGAVRFVRDAVNSRHLESLSTIAGVQMGDGAY